MTESTSVQDVVEWPGRWERRTHRSSILIPSFPRGTRESGQLHTRMGRANFEYFASSSPHPFAPLVTECMTR